MPVEAPARLPGWLRRPVTFHGRWNQAESLVRKHRLHTVCEEARCPNRGECWSHGNVSFMILGQRCTRACAFCAVDTARPAQVDEQEPARLAEAARALGLRYVVLTSPARDDLPDEGSGLFAACVRVLRERAPEVQVEVLTPDFHARPELIGRVTAEAPAVYNHNLETVRRLSRQIRPQAGYARSLEVLRVARRLGPQQMKIKSGLMVGLGETPEEVREAMIDLRSAGCEILTIGQYLRPTPAHREAETFVAPEQFDRYRLWGQSLGFSFVAAAPFVRSSYNAYEALHGRS